MTDRRKIIAGAIVAITTALILGGPAHAQQCRPKIAGYFMQMAAFSNTGVAPGDLAGIAKPLTATPGDPALGKTWFADSEKGNCLVCHAVPSLAGAAREGDLGPNLDKVAQRYTKAQLRQLVVDPKVLFPNTIMPAYYKSPEFTRVPQGLIGKTVLSASEVEDIIAFLETLK